MKVKLTGMVRFVLVVLGSVADTIVDNMVGLFVLVAVLEKLGLRTASMLE